MNNFLGQTKPLHKPRLTKGYHKTFLNIWGTEHLSTPNLDSIAQVRFQSFQNTEEKEGKKKFPFSSVAKIMIKLFLVTSSTSPEERIIG